MLGDVSEATMPNIRLQRTQQSGQLVRLDRLLQTTECDQLMGREQFLDALQDAAVLAADQYHAAAVLALHESTNEFNAIHPRHVDVQKDQVKHLGGVADLG